MAKDLVVRLTLDSVDFEKGIASAKGEVSGLGETAGKGEASFLKLVNAMALGQLAADAAKASLRFFNEQIQSGVKAAIEGEQAELRFAQALSARGELTRGAVERGKALADQIAATTTFTDEQALATQRLLLSVGNLAQDALPEATQAAADLAAGLGIDLEQATMLVAKAAAGHTEALGKYGLKVDENLPKGEKFAALLGTIQDRFGGAAQAELDSFGGRVTQLGKSWDELLESLGKFITESPAVNALIEVLTGLLGEWKSGTDAANTSQDELRDATIAFGKVLQGVLSVVQFLAKGMVGLSSVLAVISKGFILVGTGIAAWVEIGMTAALLVGDAFVESWNLIQKGWLTTQKAILEGMNFVAQKAATVAELFGQTGLTAALDEFSRNAMASIRDVDGQLAGLPKVGSEFSTTLEEAQTRMDGMGRTAENQMAAVDGVLYGILNFATGIDEAAQKGKDALDGLGRKADEVATRGDRSRAVTPRGLPAANIPITLDDAGFSDRLHFERTVHAAHLDQLRQDIIAHQAAIGDIKREGSAHDREIERESAARTRERLDDLKASHAIHLDLLKQQQVAHTQALEANKDQISEKDFQRREKEIAAEEETRRKRLEAEFAAQQELIRIEEEHRLLRQLREDEDSERGRLLRQTQLEEEHEFLAQLAAAYGVTGTTIADFHAAAMQSIRNAGVSAFQAVERSAADAAFIAIKGGKDIQQVWTAMADALLKIVIQTLVRIAFQFLINRLIAGAVAEAAAEKNVPLAASNALTSMAAAPFPINLTAPAWAGFIGGLASGFAGGVKGAGAASVGSSFETGTDFVPFTGPANIHRGERIIDARTNRDLTEFLRRSDRGTGGPQVVVNVQVGELVGTDEHIDRLAQEIGKAIEFRNARFTEAI